MTRPDGPPQLVIDVDVPGARAALVIDRVASHGAFGGVRIVPDLRLDELKSGASAMGRKFAFINVPIGGAKAAIEASPDLRGHERTRLLEAFGRSLGPLIRSATYLPACDMGTDESDLAILLGAAGVPLTPDQIDSSRATALTIVEAVRQVATSLGLPLRDTRIALEGFGKVGGHVASMLAGEGVRLVAVSTAAGALRAEEGLDVARLLALRAAHGSHLVEYCTDPAVRRITHQELFGSACDILLPGVRSGVVDEALAGSIRAPAVVPFSNAGVRPEAERQLTSRGVLVVPDYVANCGGILAVDLRSAGFVDPADVDRVVATTYRDAVSRALVSARTQQVSLGEVCRQLAEANRAALATGDRTHARGVAAAVGAGPHAVIRRLAWRLHRRGVLPRRYRHLALARFLEWRLDVTRDRMIASPSAAD